MKKSVPLLLALLFLFNLAGYYIAFPVVSWCFKSTVRAGMEAGIFKKELVLVKIPVSLTTTPNGEFQLTDEDEFQYKGKFYDVSSKEIKDGTVYYYCYADFDEDQLMVGLDNHVKSDSGINAPDHKNGTHTIVNSPIKEYIKTLFIRPDIVLAGSFSYAGFMSGNNVSEVPDIRLPPPKFPA